MRVVRLVAVHRRSIVIVQVAVFPHLRLVGVVPDLGLLVAIAVGVRSTDRKRARSPASPPASASTSSSRRRSGLNALAYALVGYGVGVIEAGCSARRVGCRRSSALLGGLAGGLVFIGIGVLAGVDSVKGTHGVVTIALAALYDALLAPFVFFLVALAIGGATIACGRPGRCADR